MRGRSSPRPRPDFGTALVAARLRHGWTQEDLARELGIARSLVRYYERDARNPKIDIVRKCAAALQVPIESLLGVQIPKRSKREFIGSVEWLVRRLLKLEPAKRRFAVKMFSEQLTMWGKQQRHGAVRQKGRP